MHTVRFWARVDKRGPDECWLWQGAPDRPVNGYGRMRVGGGRVVSAHRFAYELVNGPIATGLCVCHRCDVPLCVNPAHLFVGTVADNNADRDAKGRQARPKGEQHGGSKLSPDAVRQIRNASENQPTLARRFGVTQGTVSRVQSGKLWGHL